MLRVLLEETDTVQRHNVLHVGLIIYSFQAHTAQ
jgi:hypothetical protein